MPAPPPRRIVQALLGTPKGGHLPAGLLGSQGSLSKYTPTMREKIAGLLAKNWYGDSREGYQQANRLVNVGETVVPPLGLMTGMYDAGRAAGGGNMMQAGLIGGMAALPLPPAIKKGIRAYHGSPHSFDKFSMDKIGTGEGAQAYGHGLYFAEGEGVAKSYRDALSRNVTGDSGVDIATSTLDATTLKNNTRVQPNFDEAIDRLQKEVAQYEAKGWPSPDYRRQYDEAINHLKKWKTTGRPASGHMYEVNIDADPDQFLDWDKPIKDQPFYSQLEQLVPDDIRGSFKANAASGITGGNAYYNYFPKQSFPIRDNPQSPWKASGAASYDEALAMVGGDKNRVNKMLNPGKDNSSEVLRQAGIPGIKYLDAGSRAKGDGSRNYVVFDEKLISIVRKYGIAGASTLLGYDLLSNVTTDQAEKLKQAERVY